MADEKPRHRRRQVLHIENIAVADPRHRVAEPVTSRPSVRRRNLSGQYIEVTERQPVRHHFRPVRTGLMRIKRPRQPAGQQRIRNDPDPAPRLLRKRRKRIELFSGRKCADRIVGRLPERHRIGRRQRQMPILPGQRQERPTDRKRRQVRQPRKIRPGRPGELKPGLIRPVDEKTITLRASA